MINAADNRRPARHLSVWDVAGILYLAAMTFVVWDSAGFAESAVGFAAGIVVASWPVLLKVASAPEARPTLRRVRKEEHLLRAARKVAAVATPPERPGGAR